MSVKTLNILGVTGSVGQAAADVVASAPERFAVRVVTGHRNVIDLANTAKRLNAAQAVIADEAGYAALKDALAGTAILVSSGPAALHEAAAQPADLTLNAIVGMAGLRPLWAALEHSKAVAIANKEPLVAAGNLVMARARQFGTTILPVDSEHNAVFQVFENRNAAYIERIVLTASGGPFRTWSREQMSRASITQALAHPNWSMGRKISIDCATMMNKGLEIIEAHHLFGLPSEKIDVRVHPQSLVHALVEYADGSVLAQLAASDMRTPLAQVLAWPERMATPGLCLDWDALARLDFEPPDADRFPALTIAREALEAGPGACLALNAANEIAVMAFLEGKTDFFGIINVVRHIMDSRSFSAADTLEHIEAADRAVREAATAYITDKTLSQNCA